MEWSQQQDQALRAIGKWLKTTDGAQVFRLFGYAGSGKTTLARHIAEQTDGEALFGAYTGKAAMVLRNKGCPDARTIHSMIYRPRELDSEEPTFILNDDSPAAKAHFIIIDECSMVDEELGRDLLSFGKKVLVLGDPAQLPPVRGGGFFTEHEPDFMLTDVHRQAADNPIVRISMRLREGERLSPGDYGDMTIVPRGKIDATRVMEADQILVGMNKTRRAYNRRLRELHGYKEPLPEPGEKLVCLKNDKTKGLLNGGLFRVEKALGVKRARYRMTLSPEEASGQKPIRVGVLPVFFEGAEETLSYAQRRESDEFDYGYALTVHKAQGSQWDNVVLFDESWAFREHRERWLYTGVTRAAKKLTVVL